MLTEGLVKSLLLKPYLIKISSNFSQHQFKISKAHGVVMQFSFYYRLILDWRWHRVSLLLARSCPCLVVLHNLLLDLFGGPLGMLSPEAGVGRLVELEEP